MDKTRSRISIILFAGAICLLASAPLMAAESSALLNLRLAHHSNIPNAADAGNRFADRLVQVDYQQDWRFVTTPGNWFSAGLLAQADAFQHTRGLNRAGAGVSLAYSHKFGLGLQAPRLSLRSQLLYQSFDGSLRNGLMQSHSASLSRWMSDRVLLSGHWSWSDRRAPERTALRANPAFGVDVFEQEQQALNLQLDYLLNNGQALSATLGVMDGDIAASARPGTALRRITTAIARDNGIDRGYLAYKVEATTRSAGLTWSVPLTGDSSVAVGAERRLARAAAGVRYQETRFHIDYLVRF